VFQMKYEWGEEEGLDKATLHFFVPGVVGKYEELPEPLNIYL